MGDVPADQTVAFVSRLIQAMLSPAAAQVTCQAVGTLCAPLRNKGFPTAGL